MAQIHRLSNSVINMPIDVVQESQNNANKHDEQQVAIIADSILHFGWTYPLLITKDKVIVAGHGRYQAAKRLGLEQVPCMYIPDTWTPEDIRAYMLADNAIQERSYWDENLLSLELNDLNDLGYDLNLTGFTAEDLSSYMGYEQQIRQPVDNSPVDTNDTRIECPRCGYKWKQ